jgi:general secretion pathway protein D
MKIPVILLSLMWVSSAAAGDVSASSEADTGIPIERIITSVAHQTHRKFVIDPRVQARVHLVGEEPAQVSYNELLTILELHGFVTFESSGYVVVMPDANARQVPQPMLTKGQTFPDAQVVNYTIPIVNGPAGSLVPILRPLLPQYAQLAAAYCSNSLLITDRYANVKRIEAIVKALDVGTAYKPEKCEMANPGEHRDQPAKRSDP